MAEVVVEGLGKFFGKTRVLDDVTVTVPDGEMLCLLGPSGCGKTTTLRCIGGFEDVDEGSIRIGGTEFSRPGHTLPPQRRDTGVIFQAYGIWPHMTAAQNVAFGLHVKRLDRSEIARRVAAVLEFVGLGELGDRNATQLSGGQQQRLAIARSLVVEPKVLLFDEPLSNLDAKLREKMRVELAALQKRIGITSVYVTHDQIEAMTIADRIAVMHQGRVVEIGTPQDLYDFPKHEFTAAFLGAANIWDARVHAVSAAANGGVLMLSNGCELSVSQLDSSLRVGDSVMAMVRPNVISISSSDDAEVPATGNRANSVTTWPAAIRQVTYVGTAYELVCDVEGAMSLELHVPAHSVTTAPREGDSCVLSINANDVRILVERLEVSSDREGADGTSVNASRDELSLPPPAVE